MCCISYRRCNSHGRNNMIGTIKIRCPVCFGTGKVATDFGSSVETNEYFNDFNAEQAKQGKKTCPACKGTGMQEVSYVMELWNPNPLPNPLPNPNNPWVPIPNYVPYIIPYQQQQNPCEYCSWTQEMRAKAARGETYIGDSPCSWCPHGPHVTCNTDGDSRSGGQVFR